MSTSHHPQTDGQTERVNRVLEDMLRHYVKPFHDNWDDCLDAAEFAINKAWHATTNTTPFRLQYGFDPRTPLMNGWTPSKVMRVNDWADRISRGLTEAKQALAAAKERQNKYADVRRRPLTLTPGQKVLLSTKHLNLKSRGSVKLLPKWVGPFTVTHKINEVAFRLALPTGYKIHDICHVSVLKPFEDNARSHPPTATRAGRRVLLYR
jgi:hypothetical protein